MTLLQILDASGLAILTAQSGWIVLLYRRMGSLRTALGQAGTVIAQLDAASQRLDLSASGIARKVKEGLTEVDSKLNSCRHIAQELTIASRNAEEVAARLDQALRQSRKLNNARVAAPPRELVEPLGFAEKLAARLESPSPVEFRQPEQILAAELTFAPAPGPAAVAELAQAPIERAVRVKLG